MKSTSSATQGHNPTDENSGRGNGWKHDFGRFEPIFLRLGWPSVAKFAGFIQYLCVLQPNRIGFIANPRKISGLGLGTEFNKLHQHYSMK